jgi:2-dehydropantoate 2-reductase
MPLNIAVVGVGGVGGYFGGKMALAAVAPTAESRGEPASFAGLETLPQFPYQQFRIFFIARGAHFEAIRSSGLILNEGEKRGQICRASAVVPTPASLGVDIDVWFLCVKSYDLAEALASISPLVKRQTLIVPLLNGVDIYRRVRSVVLDGRVLPACVYVGTHIEAPGVVTQNGGDGKILLGEDPLVPGEVPQSLMDVLHASGIQFEISFHIRKRIWEKFLFIATFGLLTAGFDQTLGGVLDSPELSLRAHRIVREIETLAKKEGVNLEGDVLQLVLARARSFPPNSKTSLQRDVETKGRCNEGDLYWGTLLRLGEKWGVDVPTIAEVGARIEERIARQA